jgi:hypothetical protein
MRGTHTHPQLVVNVENPIINHPNTHTHINIIYIYIRYIYIIDVYEIPPEMG